MAQSLSTSVKELANVVDDSDHNQIESDSNAVTEAGNDQKIKFICDNKQIILKAVALAKVFTGKKGDKILDSLVAVINSLCPDQL